MLNTLCFQTRKMGLHACLLATSRPVTTSRVRLTTGSQASSSWSLVMRPSSNLQISHPQQSPVYEQRRVDLATFRAVPASAWGHCPQVLLFTIVWDTPGKEKVAKWSAFRGFSLDRGSKNPSKLGQKRNFAKSTRVHPPTGEPFFCIILRSSTHHCQAYAHGPLHNLS